MSERFYVSLPLTPGPFVLDGSEAHHLATVCRLRVGAEVCLFNGDGHEYPATVAEVSRRDVSLEVSPPRTLSRELGFTLEIGRDPVDPEFLGRKMGFDPDTGEQAGIQPPQQAGGPSPQDIVNELKLRGVVK